MFRIQVVGVVDDGFTSAEVYSGDALIAVVYELEDGWKLDLYQSPRGLELAEFLKALQAAQARLLDYVNRRGENPPEGLSCAAFSMWLLEKTDGTAWGVKLPQSQSEASPPQALRLTGGARPLSWARSHLNPAGR